MTKNQGFSAVSDETQNHPLPQPPETLTNRQFLLYRIVILSSKMGQAHKGSDEH